MAQRSANRRVHPRDARRAWEDAIDVWEDFQETGKDYARDRVHGPALLRALGPVRGLRILDLGCGQGRFTRILARRGAKVVGIDWSTAMIRVARRHEAEAPLGIEYHHLDARKVQHAWPRASFDRVVACMSLMDMPDAAAPIRGAHRLLRADGRLVFSVSHPFSTAALRWENPSADVRHRGAMLVDRYFEEGPRVTEWSMKRLKRPFTTPCWHRTFETWFRLLWHSGFEIESLSEPHPSPGALRSNPLLAGSSRVPFYLVLKCRLREPIPAR